MRVLVAVATRHEATREIAETIAEELREAGLEVDLRLADPSLAVDEYEAVVLGSAVYMGRWLPAARHFVEGHFIALKQMPVWLFSSGPIGDDDPEPHGDPLDVRDMLDATHAREHRIFAGRLDKRRLGLLERLMVRIVKAPEGDYRDWEDVREWARSVASSLVPVPTH